MKIIPLPNYGGVFPIMQAGADKSYHTGEEFEKYYDQLLQIKDLKLIVFDPLASFVHADVNADPAAGAALMGLTAKMATETGATVLLCHHMAKIKDSEPPSTPEEARNLIRGTSALVDGVRFAYAVWNVRHAEGEKRADKIGVEYKRNMFFDGAVVKSNGPADREIRKFVRDMNTGLLVDKSDELVRIEIDEKEEKVIELYRWIERCEREGNALTHQAGQNALHVRSLDADCPEILKNISIGSFTNYLNTLMNEPHRMVKKYTLSRYGNGKVWLGTLNGLMSRGEYVNVTARDNL